MDNLIWCKNKKVGTPVKLKCVRGEKTFHSEKFILKYTLDCQCPVCYDWLCWWRNKILNGKN